MKVFNTHDDVLDILSNAIAEGVIVINEKQHIIACNDPANDIFGYGPEELIGKPIHVLIPLKHRSEHAKNVAGFIEKAEKRAMGQGKRLDGLHKEGRKFPVEISLNPFKIIDTMYVMAIVVDISNRIYKEDEILELNEQLEEWVGERTRALNNTVDELADEVIRRKKAENKMREALLKEQELGELKGKFLSLVSHEFKTPISTILTAATLAEKYTTEEQSDKRAKHLGTIKNKVKYLDSILNDFLSIERLESGKATYKYTIFPLSKVLNEVVYEANMLLKEGQVIHFPEDIAGQRLIFDEKILHLALTNLLGNAIKYSKEGKGITVQVAKKGGSLLISIIDEGIGIPLEDQKHIFQRYFRAGNALMDQGTGIGLNIIKSHLNNLRSDLYFMSKENQGSTFIIKLPEDIIQ